MSKTTVVVTAHNEAERIGETLAALSIALAQADLVVADDYSSDQTAELARRQHATVVPNRAQFGKGQAATAAVAALEIAPDSIYLLCDGDLGSSASNLVRLVEAVRAGETDLAIAKFATKRGGGFGIAVGFARWAIKRLTGLELEAPICGQRAMTGAVLEAVTPFADGFAIEMAMTVEAERSGFRVRELEVELDHRVTGRTFKGFLHRARQFYDFLLAYRSLRQKR